MKICIALSGGVDSSVAALLLKRAGYDVFALFMQNWHDTTGTLHGDCEWEEDRFVAEMVARKIGIPFYFVDLSDEYRKRVVDYMFSEYEAGRTPNPDVLCNREIKFDAFLKTAEKLGADMVATGHYCRKDSFRDSGGREIFRILEGRDPGKDQSYFLCQLSQEQLSKALFPIGDMLKSEVRALAREADLPSAEKKDSQGICFVGKVDLPTFLQQKLKAREGDVVEVYDDFFEADPHYLRCRSLLKGLLKDKTAEPQMISSYISEDKSAPNAAACRNEWDEEALRRLDDAEWKELSEAVDYSSIVFESESYRSGKKHLRKTRDKANPWGKRVGVHDGAQFYTIGQRKGLNIGGHKDSIFVIESDIERNILYVGEGHGHKGLSRSVLRILPEDIHAIREDLVLQTGQIRRCRVRIRYRQPLQDATLIMRDNGLYILFDSPQRGVTPGQFAVWYESDGEMTGSGVISR